MNAPLPHYPQRGCRIGPETNKRKTWPHDLEIWVMKGGLKIQLLRKKRYEHQCSAAQKANSWNAKHVPPDLKGLYEQAFITPLCAEPL